MPTPAKKSAPRKAAAAKSVAVGQAFEPAPLGRYTEDEVAQRLAMDWLIREAFRHGRWNHAPVMIEDSTLPDEVKEVLLAAYERANV